ncbi:hypothetical protein LTR91_021529 [Friedmanniomyces endolithicus]|uniref:S-adenosyl-L-methionine-dependent methyltransferase n=1 Tax=Friedmanniomyces endolithicus TaxID=329885 RepID=A0AAN6H7V7_9PEZI|nr:hypothetical protein LTS09_010640 [Friedmanniomyces endolithicus]KAK0335104.1 hypothetical protein LTR94_014119 [Friedmanniomyces endolithicus]KAK0779891.1 hypothetical protein LTR59_013014 [Friedmanniomyces endolithicus]KAK0784361.1 hypothetical protein LTR38_012706 [Friedmanniomyces endolithicus]KAK0794707.1 hypothetical protein LTR75_010732 [Friedmanniomyces endolithicus]
MRLRPSLFWQARALDSHLPLLLPVCRDLQSARNELRWLSQHVDDKCRTESREIHHNLLSNYVRRRAGGEPLQYILGSEWFGDLKLYCRPGVLIPRPETAASTSYLVHRLSNGILKNLLPRNLRVLDLCTGSGCIPLLFHHEFYSSPDHRMSTLELIGMDLSNTAIRLAEDNVINQLRLQQHPSSNGEERLKSLRGLRVLRADVMETSPYSASVTEVLRQHRGLKETPTCDIIISNPPYISAKAFRTTTARSVRHFEPRLALVPHNSRHTDSEHDGDAFYPRLLAIANELEAKAMLAEVADMEQALRVAALAVKERCWEGIEIWRDDPATGRVDTTDVGKMSVRVLGDGHGRSVFLYRRLGAAPLAD